MLWAEEGSEALVLVDRNLYSNKISGSMPTEIGKLARLQSMYNAAPATLCDAAERLLPNVYCLTPTA